MRVRCGGLVGNGLALAIGSLATVIPLSGAHAEGERFDRRATLALVEQDFLREDSRVLRDREGWQTIEASLSVDGTRYTLILERPQHHEFLLVIEARDGARCPGLETIIAGTRSGRIYQGVCQANVGLNLRTAPAYFEAEAERLLRLFHPLFAPPAPARREAS
jgi:hypothetical protein